jgi:2-amino-4-hydroxy-6-hydroxymethyldihydropteridine diphosphokinase
MSDQKRLYIGLGSNVGNRFSFLQSAIDSIHCEVGSVIKISSCYETPAIGFKGDAFINACIEVRTCFSAELALSKLLHIEEQHGENATTMANIMLEPLISTSYFLMKISLKTKY